MKEGLNNSKDINKQYIFKDLFKDGKEGISSRSEIINKYEEIVAEFNPEFLSQVSSSVKDLIEISNKINERAWKRINENKIDVVETDQYHLGGFSTKEGVKSSKIDAPNFFENPDGYTSFMKKQNEKTSYSGLDEKQREELLKSMLELKEAIQYRNEARNYVSDLLIEKSVVEQNKEKYKEVFQGLENVSIPINLIRAKISGKFAMLKYSFPFAVDKIKILAEKILSELEKETNNKN